MPTTHNSCQSTFPYDTFIAEQDKRRCTCSATNSPISPLRLTNLPTRFLIKRSSKSSTDGGNGSNDGAGGAVGMIVAGVTAPSVGANDAVFELPLAGGGALSKFWPS